MLWLPLLLCLIPFAGGVFAFAAAGVLREKMAVVAAGGVTGLAVFTTVTYVASLFLPLSVPLLLGLLGAVVVGIALLLWQTEALASFGSLPLDWIAVTCFIGLVAIFSLIAPKLLIKQSDGLFTGILNAYGDVAWHLANITAFAEGQSVPPENPILAGTRLTYPFLSNFFSALLLKGGADFAQSVTLPALLLIPLLILLVYIFARDSSGDEPEIRRYRQGIGLVAMLLFLLGGGTLGWIRFWPDWQNSGVGLGEFLTHLPIRDYTGVGADEAGYHFLNPVTSLLLPQRSFLFGLPLAMIVVLLLLRARTGWRHYALAGLVVGLLPLFHAHTLLALLPVLLALFLLRPGKGWLYFVGLGALIGLPEVWYYVGNTARSGSFLRWAPGWTVGEHNVVWFWLKNTGLILPAGVAGLFLTAAPKPLKALTAGALAIFVGANLWLFAPWAWDNFKLLVFWLLWSLPLIGYMGVYIWKRWRSPIVKVLLVLMLAGHLLAGTLDLWKVALPTAMIWNEWEAAGISVAQEIKARTQPGEVILTAPVHNSPVVLAGRPLYLGYPAHVWSHGGNPTQRERAGDLFYRDRLTELPETLVTYVLVGPSERALYPTLVIRPEWSVVARVDQYTLYQIRPSSPAATP